MRRWVSGWVGLLLAAILLVFAAPGDAQPRIVAVGDLHGDYAAYAAILRAARLVDGSDRWAGGDAILVQTGDVADRGPDSLRIIRSLMRLEREAQRAGGRVVALVGNHEAMNVVGDLRYVHPGEYAAFADRDSARRRSHFYERNRTAIETHYRARDANLTTEQIREAFERDTPLGQIEHRAAWGPNGEIGRWVVSNAAVALIDGNLFVHGGVGAAYSVVPIDEINRRVAAALRARDTAEGAIINDQNGPLWYRRYIRADAGTGLGTAAPAPVRVEAELAAVLEAHRARRMIVGHTPNRAGIQLLHGGRLIAIDTGIAAHYGGAWTYLEIAGGQATPHVVPGGGGVR